MNALFEKPIEFSKAVVMYHYYTEAWLNNAYDGDDSWYSRQICYVSLMLDTLALKRWYYTNIRLPLPRTNRSKLALMRGGSWAQQKEEFFLTAKRWYWTWHGLVFHTPRDKKYMRCDQVYPRVHAPICPQVSIHPETHIAYCRILPSSYGYSGSNYARRLPENLECDVFRKMHSHNLGSWSIPAYPLMMNEVWEALSPETYDKFEAHK